MCACINPVLYKKCNLASCVISSVTITTYRYSQLAHRSSSISTFHLIRSECLLIQDVLFYRARPGAATSLQLRLM